MLRYLLAFSLAFLVTTPLGLAVSSFRSADIGLVRKALATHSPSVFVLGNSVIDHSSKCDKDRRSIAALLGAATGRNVVDVSKGGMQLPEYSDVVSLLATRQTVTALVVPLVPDMTDDAYWYRNEDIFRHLGYSAAAFKLPSRLGDLWSTNKPVNLDNQDVIFEGKRYGTASDIQTRFMAKEKAANQCPESDAVDADFFRLAHWRQSSRLGQGLRFAHELKKLDQLAKHHRWPVVYVLMPLNKAGFERAGDPAVAQKMRQAQQMMLIQLRHMGADYLDLSDTVPTANFVDRWCACGHLGDLGRQSVAQAIADKWLPPEFDTK